MYWFISVSFNISVSLEFVLQLSLSICLKSSFTHNTCWLLRHVLFIFFFHNKNHKNHIFGPHIGYNDNQNCELVILQNILFYVPQQKKSSKFGTIQRVNDRIFIFTAC